MNPQDKPLERSCDALGLCRHPEGCAPGQACQRYPFAPGAIQSFASHKRLARWVLLALEGAAVLSLVLLLGLASGYFQARGWL